MAHVRWRVVHVDLAGQRAQMSPYVDARAVIERLDAAYGVSGWGNRYRPFGPDSVGCELEVDGLVKSAVAHAPTAHADAAELAAAALTKAADMHGVSLPVDPDSVAWVEYDVDEGQPLYWPEADAAAGGQTRVHAAAAEDAVDAVESAGPAAPDAAVEPARPLGGEPAPGEAAPIKSEGQRAIDKLVDRLREAGSGLEAARLVMAHKGYGNDPDEARELYARLRQLLLEGRPS